MSNISIAGDTSGQITLQAPAVSGSTTLTLPATSGIVVATPTGTVASGQLQTQLFTAPGTWTNPGSITQVKVSVVGGGGGGGFPGGVSKGGDGGFVQAIVPVSAPVAITVGTGGIGGVPTGASGNTSSFGSLISCTGGGGSNPSAIGTPGTGTVSSGTTIRNASSGTTGTVLSGATNVAANGPGAITFSITSPQQAGIGGNGGVAPAPTGAGGVSGAVLVEFVG